jgi:hypothetical protein
VLRASGGTRWVGDRVGAENVFPHRMSSRHPQLPDDGLEMPDRNLESLEALGVIVHAHLGHGPATYHLAATAQEHLVRAACGAILEAPSDLFARLVRSAASRLGSAWTLGISQSWVAVRIA